MKTMCPPGYHHNGSVATHALGHMMYIMYIILCIYYLVWEEKLVKCQLLHVY